MFPALILMVIPCMIIDSFSKSTWFCTFWGWHKAPHSQGFDGCSCTGNCPRCGADVLQDGPGKWV